MQWLKAFHIIFMVTWFSGLFYLPRLFVYHAMAEDAPSIGRFKIMERKLYYGILAPGAILTIVFGAWLMALEYNIYGHSLWLQLKLACVGILIAYHLYCGHLRKQFAKDNNQHGHVFYRWLNEFPVLLLAAIVILVMVKPF